MAYTNKSDQAAAAKRHYESNKEIIKARAIAFKKEAVARNKECVRRIKDQPCLDCDTKFPPCVMDFDHVRGAKEADVATLVYGAVSLERLIAEIAKCELVCANCHRIRTHDAEWSSSSSSGS